MKSCPQCKRVYADETFSFCLFDGTGLSGIAGDEATQVLPLSNSFDSIITVVGSSDDRLFSPSIVFDEIACEGIAVKKLSQDEHWTQIALKVLVKNNAISKKLVFVQIQAVDDDSFEIESFSLSTRLKAGEVKSISEKFPIDVAIYQNIREWHITEIRQYDD